MPWWQRDGVVSRILVAAGVVVTLIGVVMLLVIAAQQGLLGPQARVGAGAALAVGLVAVGWRVTGRPGGRVGGPALMATGFAGAQLDVMAVTVVYDWVPLVVGLGLALAVAAAGVLVALRWDSEPLAVVAQLGGALLAPPLAVQSSFVDLVLFLTVLAVAGAVPEVLRGWRWVGVARSVPVVIALLAAIALPDRDTLVLVAASATTVAVVGLVVGLTVLRRREDPLVGVVMVMSAAPAVLVAGLLSTPAATAWCAAVAAVALGAALVVRPASPTARVAVGSVVGLATLEGCGLLSAELDSGLPFQVVALAAAAAVLRTSHLAAYVGAALTYGVGGLLLVDDATPEALALEHLAQQRLDGGTTLGGLVAATTAVLLAVAGHRLTRTHQQRWRLLGALGAGGLYAATVALVGAGTTVLRGSDGFALGHVLATVLWMSGAAGLLAVGLRRPAYARLALTGGLLLAAGSLAKLFLFDLSALSGVARAACFLVVGMTLLAAGTQYARSFAGRDTD